MSMNSVKINNILIILIFISFAISFFNKPPIYPLFAYMVIIFVILSLPMLLKENLKITKIQYVLLAISLFQLYLAVISGISIKEIFNYNCLRHDGNFYITYLPLLILPFLSRFTFSLNLKKMLKCFIVFQCLLTIILMIYIYTTNFSCENRFFCCHFLFKAHNAAGGYYMVMALFAFFYWKYEKRRKIYFLNFLLNLCALIITFSRGSIIGIFFAFLYYFYDLYRMKKLKFLTNISILIALLIVYYVGYSIWSKNPSLSILESQLGFYKAGTVADRLFFYGPELLMIF